MAEERRRRRGRRRGRSREQPPEEPARGLPEEAQPDVVEESEAPGVLPSRLRFRFGRRGRGDGEKKADERRDRGRQERPTAGTPAHVSPLSFWRRGRARTYREQPTPKQTIGRTWRRIRTLHLPPWVPVAFIIAIVFGIMAVLFIEPWGKGDPPHIGDSWQATYSVEICGQRQPYFERWPGDVTTNRDGIIYIQPTTADKEGKGASLVNWFGYGGGKLTQTEMHMPGSDKEYKNGDTCDDGSKAVLQVFVNGVKMDDWSNYIPQNGDEVRIVFGPEEEAEATAEPDVTVEVGETQPTEEATQEAD